MKILLLGPQGCGKGTIGQMLSEKTGLPLVSAGELLRAVPPESPYYARIQEHMKQGVLVDIQIIGAILRQELESPKCAQGFILEGWARQMIDLEHYDPKFDFVVVFELSRETSIKRISGRRLCKTDGKTYNIYTLPKDELAKCPGELVQRADDTEEAVKKRLATYYTKTMEVVNYFANQGKTIYVNAEP
ncbi:nucleoside monophosphate kinase, partial [Patescibacteria group bacterium]|nr:nucleoside monophosphate kinase [Patescibacteria group bacterium]